MEREEEAVTSSIQVYTLVKTRHKHLIGRLASGAELNELFAQLSQTTDEHIYRQKAQRAAQIIADERPIIAISFYTNQIAVNKRVKGFRFDPFGRSYYLNEMEF